jgi:hypothetical protein
MTALVLGHCIIKDNKKPDRLEKIGSDSDFCGPELCVSLSAFLLPMNGVNMKY